MEPIDLKICKMLAKGKTQAEISEHLLKLKKGTPGSLSSVEKKIKKIKKLYKAKTSFHLAVILTKEGII